MLLRFAPSTELWMHLGRGAFMQQGWEGFRSGADQAGQGRAISHAEFPVEVIDVSTNS
jgi:hypothetical protein